MQPGSQCPGVGRRRPRIDRARRGAGPRRLANFGFFADQLLANTKEISNYSAGAAPFGPFIIVNAH
jgi:hypothetical protein